jgi:glycosyltransferase involved in cell wall biosynthesis
MISSKRLVFHQHWLKDIYWNAVSIEVGTVCIDKHIGILKALKAYRAIICWTVHNLVDHDASLLQEELNNYALQQMTEISDHIFIHTHGAGELLSSHCKSNLSKKNTILKHSLYDHLLCLPQQGFPEEIKLEEITGKRILVSVGLVRPYKGIVDLLHAFQRVVQGNKSHNLYLVIAGQLHDPEVKEVLDHMDTDTIDCISLIARRLSEGELAGLMQLSHVSVTPYRKILTSGSYYLATTFAKPTVAPRIGMFPEVTKDGETAFLYDGSVDDLTRVLGRIATLPREELVRVGANALESCKHQTISEISKRFFSILESDARVI